MRDINLPTTDHIRMGYCTASYDENADTEFDLWLATERNRIAELATAKERERNLYTLKTMHEDLLDKAQTYNQLGQEREMFACNLAARYILGAIENIREAK